MDRYFWEQQKGHWGMTLKIRDFVGRLLFKFIFYATNTSIRNRSHGIITFLTKRLRWNRLVKVIKNIIFFKLMDNKSRNPQRIIAFSTDKFHTIAARTNMD
ncbi:hypothetical protein [Anaerovirgula multivorans]|uniref:hypothetical protein n=1 Tax=Anaerovirgula multivorans TaxID=312168 RepID=UPI000B78566A|nr:hypothetical protein [Anaerovirgula multivorans]